VVYVPMVDPSKHNSEPSGSINCREFLDYLSEV
jgi:hypothetical protein